MADSVPPPTARGNRPGAPNIEGNLAAGGPFPAFPESVSKVPAITLGFWFVKILATTLGETGGDTLSMTMNVGYLASTFVFLPLLAVLVFAQIAAREYNPWLYWATIIASTTAGTTLADYATRSLGIGYAGGSLLLMALVLSSLAAWKLALGSISASSVRTPQSEMFYWVTITFSQTLGTALGDWLADAPGMGYLGAAGVFSAAIAVLAAAYWRTRISHVLLFWAAFILTRPLGATVGDFLDKPVAKGGLDLSRPAASAVLLGAIVLFLACVPGRSRSLGRPNFDR